MLDRIICKKGSQAFYYQDWSLKESAQAPSRPGLGRINVHNLTPTRGRLFITRNPVTCLDNMFNKKYL